MAMGASADRVKMIEEAAYYRAQQREFGDGSPFDDWLAAEADIDAQLSQQGDIQTVLEQRLDSINAELKAFRKDLASFEGKAREQFEQGVETLGKLRDRFRKRVRALGAGDASAEGEVTQRLEHLWRDIAECMEGLRKA